MLCKLALRNVRRSVRDYTLYFLTLFFGVCVFYVFNSLENQWVMRALMENSRNVDYAGAIVRLIDLVSVFVTAVLAFLILYANHFLLRRRKRELGLYLLLGMEQRQVAFLLFLETLVIGLAALAAGLVLGVLLAQVLAAFTASLFQVRVEEFTFLFSWQGVGKTALYFGGIFLLVMLFNSLTVARQRLIRLLESAKKNQELKLRSVRVSVVLFLLSLALLGAAYALLLRRGLLQVDRIFALMLVLGTLGTLFFFRSLSGFLLRLVQRHKRLYLRDLNLFVLRQFSARITTNYLSMTVVCLLLLLAIGTTACSVGVNNTVEDNVDRDAPLDMTLRLEDYYYDFTPELFTQALSASGFPPEEHLESYAAVTRYMLSIPLTEPVEVGSQAYVLENILTYAMSLSDYNALLALQGAEPLTLEPGTYGIAWGTEEDDVLRELWAGGAAVTLGAGSYIPAPAAQREGAYCTSGIPLSPMLLLPDGVLETLDRETVVERFLYLAGNYRPQNRDGAEDALWGASDRLSDRLFQVSDSSGFGLLLNTRQDIYMETMGTKLLVLFLGLYLGIIFLVTSAAVLALQQLSQAADNLARYRILARLGADEKMRDRSSDIQVLLAFLLPLSLAVVHATVGMKAANDVIATVGHLDAVSSTLTTALFILLVYGAYFLATCRGSRRIIRDL